MGTVAVPCYGPNAKWETIAANHFRPHYDGLIQEAMKQVWRLNLEKSSNMCPYPEKLLGGARVQGSIRYLCLLSQVFSTLNGRNHPLHRQEGSQVGSVRRDDDQSEKPPHTSDYPTWQWPTSPKVTQEIKRIRSIVLTAWATVCILIQN